MKKNSNQQNSVEDSPGLQATKSAVEFVNKQVLQAKVDNSGFSAKPLADQAAAMMIEDARAFLQGSEQIAMAAMSKAISMSLSPDPETQATGAKAIKTLEGLLGKLSVFATDIGKSASGITNSFDK